MHDLSLNKPKAMQRRNMVANAAPIEIPAARPGLFDQFITAYTLEAVPLTWSITE